MFNLFKSALQKDAEVYIEGTMAHERLTFRLKDALPTTTEANRLTQQAKSQGFTYVDLAVTLCDAGYRYAESLYLMPDGSTQVLSETQRAAVSATRLFDDATLSALDRLLTSVYNAALATGTLKAVPQFGTVGKTLAPK